MSISYNTNIPFSTHNPSDDQPLMEENFNSISQWVDVDHVGFDPGGGATSGQHLQVTFNSNNVPGTPTSPPVLFTNNVLSVPQLFFYSGATFSQYSNVAAGVTGGSTYMMGGIVMKWGTVNCPDNSPVLFSTICGSAFPNNCFSFIPVVIKANTSNPINVTVNNFSSTAFTLRISFQSSGTPTSSNIYFIAVGN